MSQSPTTKFSSSSSHDLCSTIISLGIITSGLFYYNSTIFMQTTQLWIETMKFTRKYNEHLVLWFGTIESQIACKGRGYWISILCCIPTKRKNCAMIVLPQFGNAIPSPYPNNNEAPKESQTDQLTPYTYVVDLNPPPYFWNPKT